jgi:D-alanyl-D-alanine carboxypeptidase
MINTLARAVGLALFISGVHTAAFAGPRTISGVVADVDTGALLSGSDIDAQVAPDVSARLLILTMAIQDVADGTLNASEPLQISIGKVIPTASAVQIVAEGSDGHRVPLTALVGRIGHNPQIFRERLVALSKRVGMKGTEIEIGRAQDGGPSWQGSSTARDAVRLATSLMRAHGDAARTIFARTVPARVGDAGEEIRMSDGGSCLSVATGPSTKRRFAASVNGAAGPKDCFDLAAAMISQVDARVSGMEIAAQER